MRPVRWLHAIGRLMTVHRVHRLRSRHGTVAATASSGTRRARQRERTLKDLLQATEWAGLIPPRQDHPFWKALRWGGPALALGAWLGSVR
ncbi:hypothetical protein EVJ50_04295 [Synechococcus sp. RSCCF101]|uniref:hypothetical protein n=1 Tax=Synechococcus sp. RSCCF101 TaxID=2511069 RepID=UPI001246AC61|nr:hypothetical protein [Synechococcus sp. RSCCF101]QEY31591.1 hypothetical protein EVJ50_04295 [Synechococcus sp. RSCCF101]